ncbi:MAG: 30S ribosome-binding factor RbfA [Proteobacteria bacterium]|nr:30S ribosome-binding factor RbfA [Pseudomonadota bacterium]
MRQGAQFDRAERVADAIRKLVSEALIMEVSDPRVRGAQITRVRMTRDLRIARVYYHLSPSTEQRRATMARGFKSVAGFIRKRIGDEMSLKFTPEVEFYYDESVDLGERIDRLMAGERGEGRDE